MSSNGPPVAKPHRRWRVLRRHLLSGGALLGVVIPGVCPAQSQTSAGADVLPATSVSKPALRWYGYQIWTADAAAGALYLSAIADHDSPALFGTSAITFGFGGPIIHLAHRRWDAALGSLGLRIAAPLLGLAVGSLGDTPRTSDDGSGSHSDSSSKWTKLGVAVGAIAASALDGAFFSYETRERPAESRNHHSLLANTTPQLVVRHDGLTFGCAVRF